jgi:DNA-directed RNA polymerase sigma subunit (sigma70/sigma32)
MDDTDMKDKWRYVYLPDYIIDSLISTNPEDEMIRRLDGEEEEEADFSAYEILNNLSAKERRVVESICYDGKTFEATGAEMNLSKQRIHQIYTIALEKLKGVINAQTE